MTKEEIKEQLLCFSEGQDDYENVVKAFNLGLQIAADNVEADINWLRDDLIELVPGEEYEVGIHRNSILQYKL